MEGYTPPHVEPTCGTLQIKYKHGTCTNIDNASIIERKTILNEEDPRRLVTIASQDETVFIKRPVAAIQAQNIVHETPQQKQQIKGVREWAEEDINQSHIGVSHDPSRQETQEQLGTFNKFQSLAEVTEDSMEIQSKCPWQEEVGNEKHIQSDSECTSTRKMEKMRYNK